MKKVCKTCKGQQVRHAVTCEVVRSFKADCTCGHSPCPECGEPKKTPKEDWDST